MHARLLIAVVVCSLGAIAFQNAWAAKPVKKQTAVEGADTKLPDAVQATTAKHFPDAKITGFEHEIEGRRQLYFVDLDNGGAAITMLASGRGQFLGVVHEEKDDASGDVLLDLSKAPAAVKEGIEKHFGNEPIETLFMEVDDDRFIYCAEQNKAGISKWTSFSLTGVLEEEETEIAVKDLPEAARSAIAKAHANAKILSASLVDARKPTPGTHYSVDIISGKDKLTLAVSADGQITASEPTDDDNSTTKP